MMKYSDSLKKNKDFQKVYKNGTSKANRYLVMYVLPAECARNRLGISVSKKVGNSVVRHRVTRLIREIYRLHELEIRPGVDIVVVGRPLVRDLPYAQVESALMQLCDRTGIREEKSEQQYG